MKFIKFKSCILVFLVFILSVFPVEAATSLKSQEEESSIASEKILTELEVPRTYKNQKIAIDGDKINVIFTMPSDEDEEYEISGEATIGNERVSFTKKESNKYIASSTIKDLEDDKEIKIDCSDITIKSKDKNYQLQNPTDKVIYHSPLRLDDIKIESSNKNANTLIDGDTVKISFKANHPLEGTYKTKIGNKEIEFKSDSNNVYSATFTVDSNFYKDLSEILVSGNIELTDIFGNKTVYTIPKTVFTYYCSLDKAISNIKLTADSQYKADDGVLLVKEGNKITLSFETTRKVQIKESKLGNQNINFNTTDNKHFTATYQANDALTDNANIPISIVIGDTVGYQDCRLSEKDFDIPIRYYSKIAVNAINFVSNNTNAPNVAKVGDTITLSFATNHPTEIATAKIGSGDVKIETNNKMSYTISMPVIEGEALDLSNILYDVKVTDKAENEPFLLKTDQGITYYAPISISGLSLTSSNQKDNQRFCKDGDSITINLQANHQVTADGNICNNTSDISVKDKSISMQSTISNGLLADQTPVTFGLHLKDVAGNETPMYTQNNVSNQMIYYAPLSGDVTLTASGGKTPGYICNGGVVNANFSTQHAANITNAMISETGAAVNGNDATLVFNGGFIPEGVVSYQLTKEDVAGNILTKTGTDHNIIYDRTAPSIRIEPQLAGFSNGNVNVNVIVDDTNIDANDTHISVNNADMGAGGTLSGTTYQKRITLGDENEYSINALSIDKAGNRNDQSGGRIIIDKSNPQITAININLNKVAVYKSGFVLSEHFKFDDKYLKTVSCVLTEKTGFGGSHSWNINDPINDEGLKTAEITSTDMANNKSDVVKYSFYIDATPPKFIVKNNEGTSIKENRSIEIKPNTQLRVELDKIWMGDEKPDHFTELTLKDKNGATVKSFLQANSQEHEKVVSIQQNGEYTLNCRAIDDVKNESKNIQYRFNVKNDAKPVVEQEAQHTLRQGLILGGVALLAVALICGIAFIVIKKKGAKL